MNGYEAWAEWRRLDYPQLVVPSAAVETSIPTKLPYPRSEVSNNSASLGKVSSAAQIGGFEAAIARLETSGGSQEEIQRLRKQIEAVKEASSEGKILRTELDKILNPPSVNDPGRTRTCNLWFRRPTPYPLGQGALEYFQAGINPLNPKPSKCK